MGLGEAPRGLGIVPVKVTQWDNFLVLLTHDYRNKITPKELKRSCFVLIPFILIRMSLK